MTAAQFQRPEQSETVNMNSDVFSNLGMNRRGIREQTLEGSISMRHVYLITWGRMG